MRSLATVGAIIVSGHVVGVVGIEKVVVFGGLRLPQGRQRLVRLLWEGGMRQLEETHIVRFLGGESKAREASTHPGFPL